MLESSKVFLEILKNSQENTCARVSASLSPATLLKRRLWPKAGNVIKKETLAQVFSYEFCEISKNTFTEHLRTTINSAQFGRDNLLVKIVSG